MAVTHGGNIFATAGHAGVPWLEVLDFSASINPLGPSPRAREAILASMDRIVHYPDRDYTALREGLAQAWDVSMDRVLVGNGATDVLFDWCRWVGPGTIAAPAFGEFHRAWPSAATCLLHEPSTWPLHGPVVLTRPANPTGHLPEAAEVLAYASGRKDPVLVDESFIDFTGAPSLVGAATGNLFVLRSLTKFWALPGLRVGALVGDVSGIAARRPPWAVNALAEAAALASLADASYAARTRRFVSEEAAWMASAFGALPGCSVTAPSANYLYVEMGKAAELVAFAAARRVLVRDCSLWPGFARPSIRVAVRRRWENEILIHLCKEFLCA